MLFRSWYGIQLFFYAALISAVFKFIYFKFMNPEFLPNMLGETLRLLDELKISSDTFDEAQMREVMTPVYMSMQYIWLDVFLGLLVSLVTAIFAKKDKSLFDTNTLQANNS